MTITLVAALAALGFTACKNKSDGSGRYAVTFDLNYEGAPALDPILSGEDGTINTPASSVLVRPSDETYSYSFGGWYFDAACAELCNTVETKVTSDITLYAGWTQTSASADPADPADPAEKTLDAFTSLSEGFSSAIGQEEYFNLDLKIGDDVIAGALAFDIAPADTRDNITFNCLRAEIGNIYIEYGAGANVREKNAFYLDYGENKYRLVSDALSNLSGLGVNLGAFDFSTLIGSGVYTVNPEKTGATLTGKVLGMDATFDFAIDADTNITFKSLAFGTKLAGENFGFTVTPASGAVAMHDKITKKSAYDSIGNSLLNLLGVIDIISAPAIDVAVDVETADNTLSASGNVSIGLPTNGRALTAAANLNLTVASKDAQVKKVLDLTYDGGDGASGTAYVSLSDSTDGNIADETPTSNTLGSAKIKANISQAIDYVKTLINTIKGENKDESNDQTSDVPPADGENDDSGINLAGLIKSAINDEDFANNIKLKLGSEISLTIDNLTPVLSALGLDIGEFGSLKVRLKDDGKIEVTTGRNAEGNITAGSGLGLTLTACAGTAAPVIPQNEDALAYDDLNNILAKVNDIVTAGAVSVNGDFHFDNAKTDVKLSVPRIDVGWKGGVKVNAQVALDVNGGKHNLYVQLSDKFYLVYGGAGITLDIENKEGGTPDLDKLDKAAADLYNRVRTHIMGEGMGIKEENLPIPELSGDKLTDALKKIDFLEVIKSIPDIIDMLKGILDSGEQVASNAIALTSDGEEGEDGTNSTIETVLKILSKVQILEPDTVADGKGVIKLAYDGLTIQLNDETEAANGMLGISVGYTDGKITIDGTSLHVKAFENAEAFDAHFKEYDLSKLALADGTLFPYVTADDLCEMLDYVGATLEILIQKQFELTLEGSLVAPALTTATQPAAEGAQDGAQDGATEDKALYDITGKVQYERGEKYPVEIAFGDNTVQKFVLSPDMKAHVEFTLANRDENGSSFYLDAYFMDYDNNTGEADHILDIYLTISTYHPEYKINETTYSKEDGFNPVKLHAPVSELMTVISAAATVLNVDIDVVENLLIKTWLPSLDQQAQLQALGNGLLGGSGLLDTVNGAVGKVNGVLAKISEVVTALKNYKNDSDVANSDNGIQTVDLELPDGNGDLGGDEEQNDLFKPELNGYIKGISIEDITAPAEESGAPSEDVTTSVIGKKYTLTLDSNLIYGQGDIGDITFVAEKENYTYPEDVATETAPEAATSDESSEPTVKTYSRLTHVSLKNVYYDKMSKKLDLDVGIKYGVTVATPAADSDNAYLNIAGISDVLKALANTATHKEQDVYNVNDHFYISGVLNLTVAVGSFEAKEVNVQVRGLDIAIDENGELSVHARLFIPGTAVAIALINGNTTLDLVIEHGMVYMKRVQTNYYEGLSFKTYSTPVVIYRVMTLENFTATLMDQLNFMFNFASTISENLVDKISAPSTDNGDNQQTETVARSADLGETINKYLASLTYNSGYSSAKEALSVGIHGDALISGLQDIIVNLFLTGGDDDVIEKLTLSTKLSVKVVVTLNIDINATLTFDNPHGDFVSERTLGSEKINPENVYQDILENSPANILKDLWENGMPSQAMVNEYYNTQSGKQVWTDDGSGNCLFVGKYAQIGYEAQLGTVHFVYEDPDDSSRTIELATKYFLYTKTGDHGFSVNKEDILSIRPSIDSVTTKKGHELVWDDFNVNNFSGEELTVKASYHPLGYTMYLYSEYDLGNGLYTVNDDGTKYGFVREIKYYYGDTLPLSLDTIVQGNKISGFHYFNAAGDEVKITAENISETVVDRGINKIYIDWVRVPFNITYRAYNRTTDDYDTVGTLSAYWGDTVELDVDALKAAGITAPVIPGYEFVEWSGSTTVNGDMVITAVYSPLTFNVTAVSEYEVEGDPEFIYQSEGENVGKWVKVFTYTNGNLGETAQVRILATGEEYSDGNGKTWILDHFVNEKGEVITQITFLSEDYKLTAVWEEVEAQITFEYDIGNGVNTFSKNYSEDDIVAEDLPEVPEKEGYNGEWRIKDDADGGSLAGRTAGSLAGDTIFAYYTPKQYDITVISTVDDGLFESKGWTKTDDNYWKHTFKAAYDDTCVLENKLAEVLGENVDINGYDLGGFYTANRGSESAIKITEFTVKGAATYYIWWNSNAVNYTLHSTQALSFTTQVPATEHGEDGAETPYTPVKKGDDYIFGDTAETGIFNDTTGYDLPTYVIPDESKMANTVYGDAQNPFPDSIGKDQLTDQFMGWWYEDTDGWKIITDLSEISDFATAKGGNKNFDVYALWVTVHVSGVTTDNGETFINERQVEGSWVKTYYYILRGYASYKFVGPEDIVSSVSVSENNFEYLFNISDDANFSNPTSNHFGGTKTGSLTGSDGYFQSGILSTGDRQKLDKKTKWNFTAQKAVFGAEIGGVNYTFTLNGTTDKTYNTVTAGSAGHDYSVWAPICDKNSTEKGALGNTCWYAHVGGAY